MRSGRILLFLRGQRRPGRRLRPFPAWLARRLVCRSRLVGDFRWNAGLRRSLPDSLAGMWSRHRRTGVAAHHQRRAEHGPESEERTLFVVGQARVARVAPPGSRDRDGRAGACRHRANGPVQSERPTWRRGQIDRGGLADNPRYCARCPRRRLRYATFANICGAPQFFRWGPRPAKG